MNISATSGPNATKFDLMHHLGAGNDAAGFGLDRIRTLVSIATDRSHWVIMGVTTRFLYLSIIRHLASYGSKIKGNQTVLQISL